MSVHQAGRGRFKIRSAAPINGWVKRVAVTILAVVVLMALAVTSYAAGVIPGTDGCTWRSVDKEMYVAENEAVFSTIRIPRYLREAQTNVYSAASLPGTPVSPSRTVLRTRPT